jgi:hypothetical protein
MGLSDSFRSLSSNPWPTSTVAGCPVPYSARDLSIEVSTGLEVECQTARIYDECMVKAADEFHPALHRGYNVRWVDVLFATTNK